MTAEAAARMIHESRQDPSLAEFERLPLATAKEVFAKASVEQKRIWARALGRKVAKARGEAPVTE